MSAFVPSAPVSSAPDPQHGRGARRAVLGAFFVSVAVNALLGIAAILAPDFGSTARHVLQTSLIVSGFLVAVLAAGLPWERGVAGPVPLLTVVAAATAAALGVLGVWGLWTGSTAERVSGTAVTLATAGVLGGLIALARPAARLRWVRLATLTLLDAATSLLLFQTWVTVDESWFARALGVTLVLLGAGIVTLPVLHRLARGELLRTEAAQAEATRFCPFCGSELAASLGTAATCDGCGRSFTVSAAGERAVRTRPG